MAKRPASPQPEPGAPPPEPTFEQAFSELNDVVARLESADLPLEEALALHARGQWLAKYCADMLDKAELRLREIELPAPEQE